MRYFIWKLFDATPCFQNSCHPYVLGIKGLKIPGLYRILYCVHTRDWRILKSLFLSKTNARQRAYATSKYEVRALFTPFCYIFFKSSLVQAHVMLYAASFCKDDEIFMRVLYNLNNLEYLI